MSSSSFIMASQPPSSENIRSWFFSQISRRQFDANRVIGVFSFAAFILLSIFLRFSLWSPIQSFTGEFKMMFSFSFWVVVALAAAFFSLSATYFSTQHIFNPSNESVASADRNECKSAMIIFSALFMGLVLAFPNIIGASVSWNASITTMLFAWISVLIAAAKIATENDFRLYFSADTSSKPEWRQLILTAFKCLQKAAEGNILRTLQVFRYSFGIMAVLCVFLPFVRSHFLHLLDPVMISHVALVVMALFMLSDLICFVVNRMTMIPMEFPLPTPFFFNNIHGEVVNLINGMSSSNMFIKLFAFRDFSEKCKAPSRTSFFVLSQPGNHPKLWNAVLTKCLEVVDSAYGKLIKETEVALAKNAANLQYSQFLSGDRATVKATLLKPPTLRSHMMKPAKEPFEFINLAPITNKLKPYYEKLQKHFISPKPVIPTVECDIVIYAVEGLGSLVECSLTQDRFGIVQKNLSAIVSSFVDLASACDQLIRAKSIRRGSASYSDTRILKIRDIVVNILNDVHTAFERYIPDLNLPHEKLILLKEFTTV